MAGVLTEASRVKCGDGAAVTTSGSAKLAVAGSGVLLQEGISGKPVTACPVVDSTSTSHCKTVATVTAGAARKLMVGGMPVMLDTLAATTDGVPPKPVTVSVGQTKLTAM